LGVGKKQDELGRNRDIPELEVMDQQSDGMLQHQSRSRSYFAFYPQKSPVHQVVFFFARAMGVEV
jgi:hypothetical protein